MPRVIEPALEGRRAARRELGATLALVGGLAALVLGGGLVRRLGPHPTRPQCDELLGRYVDLASRAADPDVTSLKLAPRRALALGKATTDPDFAACPQQLTAAEVSCALGASDVDGLERCLR